VLAGQIRRGSGEAIAAVLWSSDLCRFMQMSDHLPGERALGILGEEVRNLRHLFRDEFDAMFANLPRAR
jgi:hypothetical protein